MRLSLRMLAATVVVGVAAGIAGVGLTLLLHGVQHLAFGYTENTFLIGVERASSLRRVLAVGIGGLVVGLGWWQYHRRTTARPSVTAALRGDHALPVLSTTADAVLQVVAVAAGASLGREGAPRQVGAALAGRIAERAGLPVAQQRTLLACGAGAGLAAVYNVPFGGAAFTLEVLLASAALADLVPALLTALVATAIAWPVLGHAPTYDVPAVSWSNSVLVWSLLAGPVAGLLGAGFARLTTFARERALGGLRAAAGTTAVFVALGALAIPFPQLLGNGKGMAQVAFDASLSVAVASALTLLKPVATAACLGGGAIGGLLTPSLATGATFGAAAGHLWNAAWPASGLVAFGLVGAAAVLAAAQRAPITAVVLLFDFTHCSPTLVAPVAVAVAGAVATRRIVDHWLPSRVHRD